MPIESALHEMLLPYPGKGDRLVRVYVPAHREGERLPVIYMTDGQNLFDEEHAGWGCWHTRESIEAERAATGRAAIIVGIHNDNPWRDNELTPHSIGEIICPEKMDNYTASEGECFDRFVTEVVMPAAAARFPIKSGRENTAFCGSSSGGLQAFFTTLCHPELFCAAGVLSPAFLLYAEDDLRRWIAAKSAQAPLPYLYLYTGAGDELERNIFDSVETTYDILTAYYPPQLLNEVILFESCHNEAAWEPIFKDFLHTFLSKTDAS